MNEDFPDRLAEGDLSLVVKENGAAWLVISSAIPTCSLRLATLRALDDHLHELEALVARDQVLVVLISTSPVNAGLGGYDPDEVRLLREDELITWSHQAQVILSRLEQLNVPSVAAMGSSWLGAGAELALACSYRVGADAPGVRVGFPQTTAGLIPAWGGTVRLPRLIGLEAALDLVLSGDSVPVQEALRLHLLDHLLPPR